MILARPIIQMDLDGNIIAEFPSVRKAAKQFGSSYAKASGICRAASVNNKCNKTAYGYSWKFKETL